MGKRHHRLVILTLFLFAIVAGCSDDNTSDDVSDRDTDLDVSAGDASDASTVDTAGDSQPDAGDSQSDGSASSVAQCCAATVDGLSCDTLAPEPDHAACQGNTGCKRLQVEDPCGCDCVACHNQTCVAVVCNVCDAG